MNKSHLESLMLEIEQSPTECDGFVRLASFIFNQNNIPHTTYMGQLRLSSGKCIPMHFWIKVDQWTIDYRARMWLGDEAMHGVFCPPESHLYQGEPVELNPLDQVMFDILKQKFF